MRRVFEMGVRIGDGLELSYLESPMSSIDIQH